MATRHHLPKREVSLKALKNLFFFRDTFPVSHNNAIKFFNILFERTLYKPIIFIMRSYSFTTTIIIKL